MHVNIEQTTRPGKLAIVGGPMQSRCTNSGNRTWLGVHAAGTVVVQSPTNKLHEEEPVITRASSF